LATELDKTPTYIEKITWSAENLRSAVQSRIEWNIKQQGLNPAEYSWSRIFAQSSQGEIGNFFSKLLSMAVNGPRNAFYLMILCLTNAAENNDEVLSNKHIDNVAVKYGEEVLLNLSSFYQLVYPDVHRLIDMLFRGFKSEFARGELEKRVKTEFLYEPEIRKQFGHTWCVRMTAYALVKVFYEIGVIGVFQSSKKGFVYSFTEPNATLGPSDKLHVHPGLRAYLETR
jgi:hypothetical protein